jgi:DNA repair protein RecO
MNSGYFGVELLDAFTVEFDPHPRLFDIVGAFLEFQQEHTDKKSILAGLIRFQIAMLRETGTSLVLEACANCNRVFDKDWIITFFSAAAHGFVCRDCEASFPDKLKLSKPAAIIMAAQRSPLDADEKTLNEIERVLIYYFTELLHKPPKMAKHFLVR